MSTQQSLFLHEEIMLLALRDEEGTIAAGTMYSYAVGGAILAELLLNQRIAVDDSKKKLVHVVKSESMGDPLIDECFWMLSNAKKPGSLQTWVSRFANVKDLKHRLASHLCQHGILRADEDKVLLLFTRKIYPEVDPEPENRLIEQLRRAIFTDMDEVDPRTAVLVSLASSASLLHPIFGKKELKGRKARIEQLINGELVGKATREAIEAMQAAMMVATIIPAIVTTTVVTS